MGRPKNKASKGQPAGARSASGRLRNREPGRIDPCEGVVRRRAFYGIPAIDSALCDAIGRAHTAGLLGDGERAQDLLNAGRRIAWRYWRVYGFSTPDSLARLQARGQGKPLTPDQERALEDELNAKLAAVQALSRAHRACFDQLVIDLNPDSGPAWLDRLIYAHRRGLSGAERDHGTLRLAREGLEVVA